jgi:hypothetical protein
MNRVRRIAESGGRYVHCEDGLSIIQGLSIPSPSIRHLIMEVV